MFDRWSPPPWERKSGWEKDDDFARWWRERPDLEEENSPGEKRPCLCDPEDNCVCCDCPICRS
jgi:hypothetical protein